MNSKMPKRKPLSNAELINRDSFERMRARNSRRTLDEWLSILCVVVFLLAVLFAICALLFFRTKEIVIRGGTYYETEAILQKTGVKEGDNLFLIDQTNLENRITKLFPYIESISLERQLPTTLIIHVKEDTPAYVTEIRSQVFLLSKTLRVLAIGESENEVTAGLENIRRITLPSVTYAVTGRRVRFERDSTYDDMLSFLTILSESAWGDKVERIDATSKFRISVYLDGGRYKVIFGSVQDTDAKLRFFTAIREQKLPEDACAIVDVSDLDRAFVTIREEIITD